MLHLPFTLFAMATAASLAAADLSCPPGFEDKDIGDNRCYFFSNKTKTWTMFFTDCQMKSANLISVVDALHYYPISYWVREEGTDAWIGLLNIQGIHSWVDNTPYNEEIDQFIANASAEGLYGYISADDGLIHVASGTEDKEYICYTEATHTTEPPTPTKSTTTSAPTSPAPPCPGDWIQNQDSCYHFSQAEVLWGAAGAECRNLTGELLSIHDPQLVAFLLVKAGAGVFWTGLQNHNTTYVWEDGTDTDDVQSVLGSYLDPWMEGKDCVALNKDKFPAPLVHEDCFVKHPYICYKDISRSDEYFEYEYLEFPY